MKVCEALFVSTVAVLLAASQVRAANGSTTRSNANTFPARDRLSAGCDLDGGLQHVLLHSERPGVLHQNGMRHQGEEGHHDGVLAGDEVEGGVQQLLLLQQRTAGLHPHGLPPQEHLQGMRARNSVEAGVQHVCLSRRGPSLLHQNGVSEGRGVSSLPAN